MSSSSSSSSSNITCRNVVDPCAEEEDRDDPQIAFATFQQRVTHYIRNAYWYVLRCRLRHNNCTSIVRF